MKLHHGISLESYDWTVSLLWLMSKKGALSQSSYTFFSWLDLFEVPCLWVSFKHLSAFLSAWCFLRQRSSSMKTGLGLCKLPGCFSYLAVVIQPARRTLEYLVNMKSLILEINS